MTSELRAVIDTNVIVSAALLARSIPRQAVDLALRIGRLLQSESTALELDEVLRRPKFDKYVAARSRLEFLLAIVSQAEIVPISQIVTECRDAKDNKFLELAICGHASHIISGDADLLALHPFRGVTIIKPDIFVTQLTE
jgi:uncharacterized protein